MINRLEIKSKVDFLFTELTGNAMGDITNSADLRGDLAMGDESIAEFIDALNLNMGTHIITNVKLITRMAHLYALVEHALSETE